MDLERSELSIWDRLTYLWSWICQNWIAVSIASIFILIFLIMGLISAFSTSNSSIIGVEVFNETIIIDSMIKNSRLYVMNTLVSKQGHLESKIDVKIDRLSEVWKNLETNNLKVNNQCQCVEKKVQTTKFLLGGTASVPQLTSECMQPSLTEEDVRKSSEISHLHRNILSQRILHNDWINPVKEDDFCGVTKSGNNILHSTSYISIKFIMFQDNNTASSVKASYISSPNHKSNVQIRPLLLGKSYSSRWQFSRTCPVAQLSEILILPCQTNCQNTTIVDSMIGDCSHITKEVLVDPISSVPNVILSVLVCH